MIDFGLVASLMMALGVPALVAHRWVSNGDSGMRFIDGVVGPLAIGLATGRLVTLALDDPNSLGSMSDMLVIRSGVEFWPAVAAAAGLAAWQAGRNGTPPLQRLAELAPLALIGYAAYEAACVFRDGCPGPVSPLGLRPPGLHTSMLPIGWLMALSTVIGAAILHHRQRRTAPAALVISAVAWVGVTRSIGSVWLPKIGDGLTRQHVSSLAVAVTAMGALLALSSRRRAFDSSAHRT